jgi:hypothetical protein
MPSESSPNRDQVAVREGGKSNREYWQIEKG